MSIINDALKKAAKERSYVSDFVSDSSREADRLLQMYGQQRILQRKKWALFGGISGTLLLSVTALMIFSGTDFLGLNLALDRQNITFVPTLEQIPAKEVIPAEPLPPVIVKDLKPAKPLLPKKYVKLPNLNLSGITRGRGKTLAVINNRIVGVGDNIKGAIVVKIGKDSASLIYQDQEFILRIQ